MRLKKNVKITGIAILVAAGLFAGFHFLDSKEEPEPTEVSEQTPATTSSDYHHITYDGKEYEFNSQIATILFMGVDSTDGDGIGRADTIQLYLLNRIDEKMDVIGLSRDIQTYVRVFDLQHNDMGWSQTHLALAYSYGTTPLNGAMLTSQAVSRLLHNIPINYFVAVDLTKLSLVHSIVGELEVVVPTDSLADKNPEWTAGKTITLTQDNVELFLRSRQTDINFSNNDRMQRQMTYLNAFFEKIKEMLDKDFDKTVSKLYNVSKDLITNISLSDIESFAKMLITFSYDESTDYHLIEGENKLGNFNDEFYVDEELLSKMIVDLFYKED